MANLDDYIFVREQKGIAVRTLWLIIYIALTVVTISFVVALWWQFLTNPTVTTLDTNSYPVTKIPFPGVAICSINKISKKRAVTFAKYISENSNMSYDDAINGIPILSTLYDFRYNTKDDPVIKRMQKTLEHLKLDIITIMKNLTTECNNLFKRCRWKGHKINCSEIFEMRATYDGYCCTFNYVKTTADSRIKKKAVTGTAGVARGLSVDINNDIDDYLSAPLNSQGVTVQIFVPTDYPDEISGSLRQVIAEVDTENFLQIIPTTVKTVKEVLKYPVDQRECLFEIERQTKFNGVYSQSDCNVDCRVASTLGLCECIPFMIPLSTNETVCTLNNLPCLHQYRSEV